MSNSFFRLPVISTSATIKLDPAKVTEFYRYDADAIAFWDFSKQSPLTVDGDRVLSAFNPAYPISFTSGKLNFSSASGNLIGSDLTDTTLPAHSYAAVVYIPDRGTATDILMMAGNYRRDSVGTGSALMCIGKRLAVSNGGISATVQATVDVVPGWCFISFSLDVPNKKFSCYMKQLASGAEIAVELVGTGTYAGSTSPFGLGNFNFTGNTSSQASQASEFMIFDKYLTLTQLKNKYQVARARQSKLGVAI